MTIRRKSEDDLTPELYAEYLVRQHEAHVQDHWNDQVGELLMRHGLSDEDAERLMLEASDRVN